MEEFIKIRDEIFGILNKYKYELSKYDALDIQKKNIINTFNSLDDSLIMENLQLLGIPYELNEIKLLLELLKLRLWMSKNTLQDFNEYIQVFGIDDTNEMFKSDFEIITNLLSKILFYENLITNDAQVSLNYLGDSQNLLVFLKTSGDDYFEQDLNEILSKKRVSVKNVSSALNLFSIMSMTDLRKLGTARTKKIKPSDYIADYYDELKHHRLRHNDIRVAYCQLPISLKNKAMLQQLYNNTNDINIILVLGIKLKSDDIYDEFNSRIAKEIDQIRQIISLFETDFTMEKLNGVDTMFSQTTSNLKCLEGKEFTK